MTIAFLPLKGWRYDTFAVTRLPPHPDPSFARLTLLPPRGEGDSWVYGERVPLSPPWERGGLEAMASPQGRGEGRPAGSTKGAGGRSRDSRLLPHIRLSR